MSLKELMEKLKQEFKQYGESKLASEINRETQTIVVGEFTLTYVSRGVDPLDSNTMEYVYKLDNGQHLSWSAAYTSYDNGGPDGEIESWNIDCFAFVERSTISVEIWKGVDIYG